MSMIEKRIDMFDNDIEEESLRQYTCEDLYQEAIHVLNSISKRINMRPASSCAPCAPDVVDAYNVNPSSGCGRPRPLRPDVERVRPGASDAT